MELPFHLKTLEPLPGALDILRYFGTLESDTADTDQICTALDLSERRFSKAIRRLVTKDYLTMDGEMIYRLTEQGQEAVEELAKYDEATGGGLGAPARVTPSTPIMQSITRRMIIALPRTLVAEQTASVVVGFHDGDMPAPAEIVVRLSVVNGKPEKPEDAIFLLTQNAAQEAVQVTPGSFDRMRIRAQVFQLGDNPGEIDVAGGMYVDVPVVAQDVGDDTLVAYGTDVIIKV